MFDFAWSHFALLFVIAVILLGPKELPTVLRFIGRWVGKIRQHKSEFQEYFEAVTAETATDTKPIEGNQNTPSEETPQPKSAGSNIL